MFYVKSVKQNQTENEKINMRKSIYISDSKYPTQN